MHSKRDRGSSHFYEAVFSPSTRGDRERVGQQEGFSPADAFTRSQRGSLIRSPRYSTARTRIVIIAVVIITAPDTRARRITIAALTYKATSRNNFDLELAYTAPTKSSICLRCQSISITVNRARWSGTYITLFRNSSSI